MKCMLQHRNQGQTIANKALVHLFSTSSHIIVFNEAMWLRGVVYFWVLGVEAVL